MSVEGKGLAFEFGEEVSIAPPLVQGADARTSIVGGVVKRAADIAIAAIGLLMLVPLLLLIALAVRATSRGPVFFGHRRIGAGGKVFRCWKFRSMVENGEAVLTRYLAENPKAQAEWDETRKLKDDIRITLIGRILRDYSLDELPQLVNVLRGEMSIVGPRPVVADELGLYGSDARFYLAARPGITGLWQVSGRNDVSYETRVALDKAYVLGWSVRGDLGIILRTIPAALSARGAY
ncbi:MAG: sugar transferase [Albidovulum sp.]|uniref:sugar transferase n=1 Tax=Albidovulum sp. TaxID=1872424 RepID=UPI003C8EB6B5